METIVFSAIVYRITTDKEGESRVQFNVPKSDLMEVMKVMACTETLLKVTVTSVLDIPIGRQ